jgi:hypothetical protein
MQAQITSPEHRRVRELDRDILRGGSTAIQAPLLAELFTISLSNGLLL